ncbi:MAG: hypothetical protein LUC92_03400 [Clostridiales bacterium]|nr:hypothetical protein [Clostridiales bacterium]
MKKLLFFMCICLFLPACSLNTEEEETELYILTTEDREIYNTILESELRGVGWEYDPEEIKFGTGWLPEEGDEDYESLKALSDEMSYDTSNWSKEDLTPTAAVTIYHPNGDLGGSARFYFQSNHIVCGYYTYNGKTYSIGDTAVFLKEGVLTVFENTETEAFDYTESEISVSFNGFSDISPKSGMTAVMEEGSLNFYTLRNQAFELTKSYSEDELGFVPFDAAFDKDGSCAVLGGVVDEDGNKTSTKLMILDSLLNPTDKGFDLYGRDFSQVLFDDGYVLLSSRSGVSEFEVATRQNTENHNFIHYVKGMAECDIYNNGTRIFAATDGTDLFVYSSDFDLLWRTYYNSSYDMDSFIYFSDMNGDGVKEIYTEDTDNGATVKYILTETGFKAANDIEAALYLPGDFDCNGRDEYAVLSPYGDKILN